MARGMKTGGRDFKPGHPYAGGRPPLPPEVKEARKLTAAELIRELTRRLRNNKGELEALIDNPETPMLTVIVCRVIKQAGDNGNIPSIELVLNRILGKVPDKVEIDGNDDSESKPLTREELRDELKRRGLPDVFETMDE